MSGLSLFVEKLETPHIELPLVSVPFMSGLSLFATTADAGSARPLCFSPLHVGALFVWRMRLQSMFALSCFSPLHVGALFV